LTATNFFYQKLKCDLKVGFDPVTGHMMTNGQGQLQEGHQQAHGHSWADQVGKNLPRLFSLSFICTLSLNFGIVAVFLVFCLKFQARVEF
jgi:hypothetical protein